MTRDQMQQFARFGAEARLQAISQERDAILQAFPDLGRASAQANASLDGAAPARRASAPARKRRRMSAAQRKAVGERMKAYWAKRTGGERLAPRRLRRRQSARAGLDPRRSCDPAGEPEKSPPAGMQAQASGSVLRRSADRSG